MSKFSLRLQGLYLKVFRTTVLSSPWFNLWCQLTWVLTMVLTWCSFSQPSEKEIVDLVLSGVLMFAGACVIVYIVDRHTAPRRLNLTINRRITMVSNTLDTYQSTEKEIRSAIADAEHNDAVYITRRRYVNGNNVDFGDHIVRRIKSITSSVAAEVTDGYVKVTAL